MLCWPEASACPERAKLAVFSYLLTPYILWTSLSVHPGGSGDVNLLTQTSKESTNGEPKKENHRET